MKKMMMALAALCVAGVAGAVSINWNDADTLGQRAGTITLNNKTDDFILSLKVTIDASATGVTSNDAIFTFGGDTDQGVIAYRDGGKAQLAAHFGARWMNKGYSESGTYDVKLQFVRNSAGNGWEVAMWVNGNRVGSNSGEYHWQSGDIPVLTDTQMGMVGNTFRIFAGKTDAFWVSDVSVSQVPEPTALAFLALGVAGLALRRKVA